MVIEHNFPFGFKYLYAPRPDIADTNRFFSVVAHIAEKEGHMFLKIDPMRPVSSPIKTLSNALQPEKTIMCNLEKSESELLSAMHEKTRYNIRLAERKGVLVRRGESREFESFWKLLAKTAERDGFHTHERAYYETLLDEFSEHFSNELFFAEYEGKPIAAALINFYRSITSPDGGIATYLHGASYRMHREVMAPQFLHWNIMKEARKRGFMQYDFWGIDEKRWPGVTRFKKGFGGSIVSYPESFDRVYRKNYYQVYSFVRAYF